MSIELLNALPSTSAIEAKLRAAGCVFLADSEVTKVLDRYKAARSALARSVAEKSAQAFGLAMAAAAAEEMSADAAAKVARECAAYLEQLVK